MSYRLITAFASLLPDGSAPAEIVYLPAVIGLAVRDMGKIVLDNAALSGTLNPLPDDPKRDIIQDAEAQKLPGTDQDCSLKSTADNFRAVLSTDGTLHGDKDEVDLIRQQFVGIAREASLKGCLLKEQFLVTKGGVEHDVVFDHETSTVLKFTKPGKAAYAVNFDLGTPQMVAALPLEYLDRLMLQNEIFGDNIRFVGIGGDEGGRQIITRQDLVTGKPARWEDITKLMVNDLGFSKLRHNHGIGYEDSYAFVSEDSAVFDMRPANVFVTDDGLIIPIDCIPVKLPPGKRAFFDK